MAFFYWIYPGLYKTPGKRIHKSVRYELISGKTSSIGEKKAGMKCIAFRKKAAPQ